MKKPTYLSDGIIIASSTAFLADVDRYLDEKLSEAGVDESARADIAISISELVNNAIIHGNKRDESKSVEVRFSLNHTRLRITVSDQGTGFNPEKLANPIDDENLLKEVGRGLFIVENFVDEVKFKRSKSGGTIVEIVKNL